VKKMRLALSCFLPEEYIGFVSASSPIIRSVIKKEYSSIDTLLSDLLRSIKSKYGESFDIFLRLSGLRRGLTGSSSIVSLVYSAFVFSNIEKNTSVDAFSEITDFLYDKLLELGLSWRDVGKNIVLNASLLHMLDFMKEFVTYDEVKHVLALAKYNPEAASLATRILSLRMGHDTVPVYLSEDVIGVRGVNGCLVIEASRVRCNLSDSFGFGRVISFDWDTGIADKEDIVKFTRCLVRYIREAIIPYFLRFPTATDSVRMYMYIDNGIRRVLTVEFGEGKIVINKTSLITGGSAKKLREKLLSWFIEKNKMKELSVVTPSPTGAPSIADLFVDFKKFSLPRSKKKIFAETLGIPLVLDEKPNIGYGSVEGINREWDVVFDNAKCTVFEIVEDKKVYYVVDCGSVVPVNYSGNNIFLPGVLFYGYSVKSMLPVPVEIARALRFGNCYAVPRNYYLELLYPVESLRRDSVRIRIYPPNRDRPILFTYKACVKLYDIVSENFIKKQSLDETMPIAVVRSPQLEGIWYHPLYYTVKSLAWMIQGFTLEGVTLFMDEEKGVKPYLVYDVDHNKVLFELIRL